MKYTVAALLILFLLGVGAYAYNSHHTQQQAEPNPGLPMETITVGKATLQVEVASNDAEREQGLSDRTSLAPSHGMLFVFDPSQVVGFWMKDMQFSLDMVFADSTGSIVKIDSDATPASYFDQNPPEIFSSGVPIRYVLEIPAGYAESAGLAIGQKIVVK